MRNYLEVLLGGAAREGLLIVGGVTPRYPDAVATD